MLCLSTHQSVGSFHFLSTVNNAAVNIYAQVFAFVFVQAHSVLDSRGTCGCGIAGSYGNYSYVYTFSGIPFQRGSHAAQWSGGGVVGIPAESRAALWVGPWLGFSEPMSLLTIHPQDHRGQTLSIWGGP